MPSSEELIKLESTRVGEEAKDDCEVAMTGS